MARSTSARGWHLAKLAIAEIVLRPCESSIADAPLTHRCRGIEQGIDHPVLGGRIADIAKREPKRMGDEQRARRFNDGGNLHHLGEGDRAKSLIVEDALKQSNGLLADRSRGDQQDQVRFLVAQALGDGRTS
jgi:hypothetical protein